MKDLEDLGVATTGASFAADIEAQAKDEAIESVVIGPFGWGGSMDANDGYGEGNIHRKTPVERGAPLAWETARPMLDYPYSTGYGAPECDAIYAYTAERVLSVAQYDGSTWITSIPRNPQPCKPEMAGG